MQNQVLDSALTIKSYNKKWSKNLILADINKSSSTKGKQYFSLIKWKSTNSSSNLEIRKNSQNPKRDTLENTAPTKLKIKQLLLNLKDIIKNTNKTKTQTLVF